MKIFGKYIALYSNHRQTEPILSDQFNRENYWFINFNYIWKPLRILGSTNRSKLRVYVYLKLLRIVNPRIIIDINWIGRLQIIHDLYARRHPKSTKFMVIQHGNYSAGRIESTVHRTVRCSVFWIWGDYYLNQLELNGRQFYVGGNPVYNKYHKMQQGISKRRDTSSKSVLFLNSYIDDDVINKIEMAAEHFKKLGFEVFWKPHNLYSGRLNLSHVNILTGINLYEAFYNGRFKYIITDESTTLLDAVFFKNNVLFMKSGKFKSVNLYNSYLKEFKVEELKQNVPLDQLIDQENQLKMFESAISLKDHNKIFLNSI